MPSARKTPASRRVHLVLVPGFAGFDALGQLEYYADVTTLFSEWRDRHARHRSAVLHYFDNFPTASVGTRASRLQQYLAKRVARGEFQPGDRVALVGHSTGGLDIRCLLQELVRAPRRQTRVDGARRTALGIGGSELLDFIDRVVFLSVPHRGTNIADWVAGYRIGRRLVIQQLRATVGIADLPAVRLVQDWATAGAAWLTGTDALLAVQDALREADPNAEDIGPSGVLDAQEAAAALALWLRHMATDFAVIDDLSVRPPGDRPSSPAHASEAGRARERAAWTANRIGIRSYATLARPPIRVPSGEVPAWDPLKPWTYTRCAPDAPRDALYYACYRACAGGPFAPPPRAAQAASIRYLRPAHREQVEAWGMGDPLRAWENDGIVNTASMIWPGAGDTVLVPGDHMDIVGHYRRVAAAGPSPRAFHTYDLLESGSGFSEQTFRDVWDDVFGFCCG
jgi:hypothetical protein